MTIGHVGDEFSAYLDGELLSGEFAQFSRHLAGCDSCRSELEGFAQVRAQLRSLPMLELPLSLQPAAKQVATGRRWLRLAWGTAAAALAGLVAVASFNAPRGVVSFTPEDASAAYSARNSLDPSSTGRLIPLEALTIDDPET